MKIVVVSHNRFARAALDSLAMICGEFNDIYAYGMYDDIEEFENLINALEDEECVYFADISGGHPFNTVFKKIMNDQQKQILLGGFNLPLLIEANLSRSYKTIEEMASDLELMQSQSIIVRKNWK